MAYTWRTSKTGTSASLSCTVTEPTNIAAGDVEFAYFAAGSAVQTIATPAGWTQMFDSGAGTNTRYYLFCVTGGRGGSAPGLVFTISTTTVLEWHTAAFAGANVTADASAAQALTSGRFPDPPSANASTTTDEALAFGFNFNGATWTHPAYTIRSVNTGALDCVLASKDLAASGAEDPAAFGGPPVGNTDIYAVTILYQAPASSDTQEWLPRWAPHRPIRDTNVLY